MIWSKRDSDNLEILANNSTKLLEIVATILGIELSRDNIAKFAEESEIELLVSDPLEDLYKRVENVANNQEKKVIPMEEKQFWQEDDVQ